MKINKAFILSFILFLSTLLYQIFVAISPVITFGVKEKIGIVTLGIFWLSLSVWQLLKELKEHSQKRRLMTVFIWLVFIIYLVNLVYLLFFDGDFGRNITVQNNKLLTHMVEGVNLEPFKMMKDYMLAYQNGNIYLSHLLLNVVGNLIVFAPLGILLPTVSETMDSFFRFPLLMATMIILSECAQVYFSVGVGDIDDFILNFTGVMFVFLLYRIPFIKKAWKHLLYRD